MLVLSRHADEKIFLGQNIEIVVVRVRGKTVQLGITAPKDVRVYREELLTPQDGISIQRPASGSRTLTCVALQGLPSDDPQRIAATHTGDHR